MKKKIFLSLIIIILISLILVFFIYTKKETKLLFEPNINLSINNDKTTKYLSNYSNNYYSLDIEEKILTRKEEQNLIEVSKNITKAYLDTNNEKYLDNIYKYFIRKPITKLDEVLIDNKEYVKWETKFNNINNLSKYIKEQNYNFEIINVKVTDVYNEFYKTQVEVSNQTINALFSYEIIYEKESYTYKISNVYFELNDEIKKNNDLIIYKEKIQNTYNLNPLTNISKFIPTYKKNNYSNLINTNYNIVSNTYEKIKDMTVIIDSVNLEGTSLNTISGFFLRSGVVVTSYKEFYKLNENNPISYFVIDNNEKVTEVTGIVAAYPNLDLILLKLKEEIGVPVKITKNNLKEEDVILSLSSSKGLKQQIKLGIFLEQENNIIKTMIPNINSDISSPIFNLDGEIIGLSKTNYDNSYYNYLLDIKILEELQTNLHHENFDEIKTIPNFTEENYEIINNVSKENLEKYNCLPLITTNIPLELYSAYEKDNYLIFRYYKNNYSVLTNEQIINNYIKVLINNSYEEINNYTYKKDNITITIQNNLGFIIVIVEGVI